MLLRPLRLLVHHLFGTHQFVNDGNPLGVRCHICGTFWNVAERDALPPVEQRGEPFGKPEESCEYVLWEEKKPSEERDG